MYLLEDNSSFNFKLSEEDANRINVGALDKNYWSNFYNQNLYACEDGKDGGSLKTCKFTLLPPQK